MVYPIRFWLFLLVAGLCALPLSQARAQVYYLDLSKQSLTLVDRTLQVEQVLDGRPGRPTIGLVHRGLNNRPAAVLFRSGLEAELTTFLRNQLPARSTDHAVVLCLRQLRISEQLNGLTEDASADLAADVYLHLPDGYHFVRSVAARTSERALETTALHSQHIASLLQQCLSQLTTADWQVAGAAPARQLTQLISDIPTTAVSSGAKALVPPILRQIPRRGVYSSFDQFLNNRPDTTLVVTLDTMPLRLKGRVGRALWLGVARFHPTTIDKQGTPYSLAKTAWGFSEGGQVYVQHEGGYFPLVRQAGFFTFVGEKPLDVEYVRARAQAQARAAVVGVSPIHAQDHTGEPTPYAVDMRTGQLAPFPDPLRPHPAHPDTAYVYLYRQADTSTAAVPIFLEGRQVGQLRPNEYIELPWPYYARMMRLCVGLSTPNPCQLFVPNTARASYLKITDVAASSVAPWEWVTIEQGEADLDALDALRLAATQKK